MGTRQDLRSVGVESAVVNVEAAGDEAAKDDILDLGADGRVGKEPSHSKSGANCHSVPSAEELGVAHESSKDGSGNTRDVVQCVVAPSFEGADVEDGAVSLLVLTVKGSWVSLV